MPCPSITQTPSSKTGNLEPNSCVFCALFSIHYFPTSKSKPNHRNHYSSSFGYTIYFLIHIRVVEFQQLLVPARQDVISFTTHPVANVKAKAITVLGTMSCGCRRPGLVHWEKELDFSLDSFQWKLHSSTSYILFYTLPDFFEVEQTHAEWLGKKSDVWGFSVLFSGPKAFEKIQ